ncbi:MAG: DUF3857 domain-containing protein, partial [Holophagales bacterium]|nr:DUF3857 domain-containing protein [Holophagales bacterium]
MPLLVLALLPVFGLALPAFSQAPSPTEPKSDATAPEATPPKPWLGGPFAASAAQLLDATQGIEPPDGAPAVMLYQDASYTFDRQGRLSFRRHWIYKVADPEAFLEWAKTEIRWSPWLEEVPEIRSRVIFPEGRERWLEASEIEEAEASEGRENQHGDRRRLTARLPPLEAGAVVEEEVRLVSHTAVFAAGTVHRHYVAFFIPTLDGRLVLDAPTNLALRYGARKVEGVEPETTVENGRVRVVFRFGRMAAVGAAEEGAPGHRPRFPHIAFSTGRSWRHAGAELERHVQDSVAAATLSPLAGQLPRIDAAPIERVERLLDTFRRRMRHDGLDLEATPGFPVDVDGVLERGTGDGLDLAVALIASLRRVGIGAHLVLVNAGFG